MQSHWLLLAVPSPGCFRSILLAHMAEQLVKSGDAGAYVCEVRPSQLHKNVYPSLYSDPSQRGGVILALFLSFLCCVLFIRAALAASRPSPSPASRTLRLHVAFCNRTCQRRAPGAPSMAVCRRFGSSGTRTTVLRAWSLRAQRNRRCLWSFGFLLALISSNSM